MQDVYIVDFEDRHRGVVFSTREEAQKYAASFGDGGIDRNRKTVMQVAIRESAEATIREAALAKLTPAERKALGVDRTEGIK